jgi:iron(III) transport system substrate-binding protein
MEQLLGESYKTLLPKFYDQLGGEILDSSGDVIPAVSDGTYLIGITLEETAKKYIEKGYNISLIYPNDGTSAVPDGIAMLKNAPHSYNAGKFIDFVVGYDTQKYAMENFYRRPVRTDVDLSPTYGSTKLIDFDVKICQRRGRYL